MGTIGRRGMKRKEPDFTEESMQRVLTERYMTNPKFVIYNLFVFDWESDFLLKTQAGYWYEVEIKVTLADFKNDFKEKPEKYDILSTGKRHVRKLKGVDGTIPIREVSALRPNYFSYCVPYTLVGKVSELLPPYAGLCYVNSYGLLSFIKSPQQLHKEKLTDESLNLTEKFYYACQTWRSRCKTLQNGSERTKIRELKSEISWLRAEYRAATGYDVDDNL